MIRACLLLTVVFCVHTVRCVREQRDLSRSELTRLYNTPVRTAERYVRLKNGMPDWAPNLYITTHSGVRVTLSDGRQFLIHKGPDFGEASDTVITDAAHMSSAWKLKNGDALDFNGAVTVGEMVRAGGTQYSLWRRRYCHTATDAMMSLG